MSLGFRQARYFAKKQRQSPLIDPYMTEALAQKEREAARKALNPDAPEPGRSRLQKIFGRRKKLSEEMPLLDVKGNRISYPASPDVSQGSIEKQLFEIEKGPRMLPRRTRFKAWGALGVIVGWFVACYSIVSFRLRSDDLELMEREVYEELKMKKDVEKFMKRSQQEDKIKKAIASATEEMTKAQ